MVIIQVFLMKYAQLTVEKLTITRETGQTDISHGKIETLAISFLVYL